MTNVRNNERLNVSGHCCNLFPERELHRQERSVFCNGDSGDSAGVGLHDHVWKLSFSRICHGPAFFFTVAAVFAFDVGFGALDLFLGLCWYTS